jgi:hypothetical protein
MSLRNKNTFEIRRERPFLPFDSNSSTDEISLSLLSNDALMRQVKIYKTEYYKVLDINR